MKGDPIMAKALRLIGGRKYAAAVRLLEGEAVRYHDSFRYYYLLGAVCLRTGDFGGAFTYFIAARKIKRRDPRALLGLAALFLRRGDTVQAVEIYLEVQEIGQEKPRDYRGELRIASVALDRIRRAGNPDEMNAWLESGTLRRFYPPLPRAPFALASALLPAFGTILVLASLVGVLFMKGLLPPGGRNPEREGLAASRLEREEMEAPVQVDGSYRYILTRDEAVSAYGKARRLFNLLRDEEAKVELNRLLESNASDPVRNKARLLLSFMPTPDFTTLKDSFDYPTVMREPVLYRGCHVIWEGMAANLEGGDATAFNLLVGYDDTRSVLQGIVPVRFGFALNVNTTRPLRVLGRIVPVSTPKGIDISLEGIAVQQSELLIPSR